MKKLFAAFILCAFTSLGLSARTQNDRPVTLKGHAVTEEKAPVDYATVMLTAKADSTKVYGTITDEKGGFTVEMPKGSYRLKISFMGYDSFEREVNLAADTDLGELTMKPSSVMLDEVVVTANMVTREADRFVVNVAATPLSAGKTGKEMLALSPGVWITDKGDLSVNGRGGTQVIVNDRVLKETGEELVAYLENLKAEDILKIEVIPYAGAEYDANATGGVIKITLKKQREEGLEGAVSMRYYTSIVDQKAWNYQPSLNLNYKYNALSLYSKVGYRRNNWTGGNMESDRFLDRDRIMDANTGMAHRQSHTTFQLGSVYDINDKQSVGAEFNMTENPYHNNTDGTALAIESGNSLTSQSLSRSTTDYSLMSFTANYSLKLDTLGSTFKTVANYTYRNKEDSVYYHTNYSGMMNYDSTSRYMPTARYDMFAIRSDFDIALSKSSKLATGLKYQRNTMDNVNPYDYFKNDIWIPLPERSSINKYTENIGALYASFSTKFRNNTSLLVGLRGEYTYAVPATNSQYVSERQKYFDLFPNANLSIPLNKQTEPDDYPRLRTQNRTTVILATEPIPPTTIRLYVHGRQPKIKTVLYKRLHAHLGALSQIYADARRTGGKRCVQYNRRHRSFRLEHPNRPAKQYAQTDELQREPQYPGPDYQMVDAQREPERQPQREHADATGRTSKGDYLYFPRKHEQHLHLQEKLQFHNRGILHEPVTGRKRPGGGLPHGQCRPERQLL